LIKTALGFIAANWVGPKRFLVVSFSKHVIMITSDSFKSWSRVRYSADTKAAVSDSTICSNELLLNQKLFTFKFGSTFSGIQNLAHFARDPYFSNAIVALKTLYIYKILHQNQITNKRLATANPIFPMPTIPTVAPIKVDPHIHATLNGFLHPPLRKF